MLKNTPQVMDGLTFLQELPENFTTTVFFDPQYRGILDKLQYGNEGARQKQRAQLPQMTDAVIADFLQKIYRILAPNGYLFFWADKYIVCTGQASKFLQEAGLHLVDMITWDKGRIGMGYRTRRRSEYLVIAQKFPFKAKATWVDHSIPDVWAEPVDRARHAHAKPVLLQARLIEAVTPQDQIVVDPAAGSYTVLEACRLVHRDFLGCDLNAYSAEILVEEL
jgi:site-specific DNA-methyltransferase (adenine-specific)